MCNDDFVGTVIIPLEEYKKLLRREACYLLIQKSIIHNIDNGKAYPVDDEKVMLLTGTLDYEKKAAEEQKPEENRDE